jgi:hypothetical protein
MHSASNENRSDLNDLVFGVLPFWQEFEHKSFGLERFLFGLECPGICA